MAVTEGVPVSEGIGRQVDYWLTVYRRTWKGTAISSFVAPLFYVVAMGVLLGGFIEVDPSELEGATSSLEAALQSLYEAAQQAQGGMGGNPPGGDTEVEPGESQSSEPRQAKGKVVEAEVVDK